MNEDQWQKIQAILEQVLEIAPNQRPEFLQQAYGNEPDFLAVIERYLKVHGEIDSFMEEPIVYQLEHEHQKGRDRLLSDLNQLEQLEIKQMLGEGGMGKVFLAQQSIPIKRLVALKVLKSAFYEEKATQRFMFEVEALAKLNHPHIAKIFLAGTTPNLAQPYFLMEYLPGEPIHHFVKNKALPLIDKLQLFLQVCDAVNHVHQLGVIHRDLKPSNILVTDLEGKPCAKVIDFGIAKFVRESEGTAPFETSYGMLLGTPAYMSPEQLSLGNHNIDVRTDLYGLGCVLYELLTTVPPFERTTTPDLSPAETYQHLLTTDPPTVNARLRQLGHPTPLDRDLNVITAKAMAKDKDKRYQTVKHLSDDLRRHLEGKPISIRQREKRYVLSRNALRHKTAFAVVALFLLLAVTGTVGILVQWRATLAANEEKSATLHFLEKTLTAAKPGAMGRNTLLVETLEAVQLEIAHYQDQPKTQARLHLIFGQTFSELADYGLACFHLEQALKMSGSLSEEHRSGVLFYLALTLQRVGRYQAAMDLLSQLQAGEPSEWTLLAHRSLAEIYRLEGRYHEARDMFEEILSTQKEVLGYNGLITMRGLGLAYVNASQTERGIEILQDTYQLQKALLGEDALESWRTKTVLAAFSAPPATAAKICQEAVAVFKRELGPDHADTRDATMFWARALYDMGRYEQALPLLETIVPPRDQLLTERFTSYGALTLLAMTQAKTGRNRAAQAGFEAALDHLLETQGWASPKTHNLANNFANTQKNQGLTNQAVTLLQCLERDGPAELDWIFAQCTLGEIFLARGEYAEALVHLERSYHFAARLLPTTDPRLGMIRELWGTSQLLLGIDTGADLLTDCRLEQGRISVSQKLDQYGIPL